MNETSLSARPSTLCCLAFTAIFIAMLVGGGSNAINGLISPDYFRAAQMIDSSAALFPRVVAHGILQGLLFGTLYAAVFSLVLGLSTKGCAGYGFGLKHLLAAVTIVIVGWVLIGLVMIGISLLSSDLYRRTFGGSSSETLETIKHAWACGSFWGLVVGGVLSLVIVSVMMSPNWKRRQILTASLPSNPPLRRPTRG